MSGTQFVLAALITQTFFLSLDFWYMYRLRKQRPNLNQFRFYSILFLTGVVICYAIIQYAGFAILPKTEVLIQWFKDKIVVVPFSDHQIESLPLIGWWLLGIFAYFLAGFWDYVVHRFFSHSKALFFTHEYHHLPNRLFLALPGLIARPFSVFSNAIFLVCSIASLVLILKMIGLSGLPLSPIFFSILYVETTILAMTHSEFLTKQWWIYRLLKTTSITTPQEHEMHHTVDLRGNFGDFTILWDKIFNTYIDPTKPENKNHALGLGYDQDFLGTLTMGKLKFSKRVREKYQIGEFCNIQENQNPQYK